MVMDKANYRKLESNYSHNFLIALVLKDNLKVTGSSSNLIGIPAV